MGQSMAIPRIYAVLAIALLAVIILSAIYWARDILSPFIIALLLAYLGNPLVTKMANSRVGQVVGRPIMALIVTVMIFSIIAAFLALLGPMLYEQLQSLLKSLPQIFDSAMDRIQNEILPLLPKNQRLGLPSFGNGEVSAMDVAGPIAASVLTGGASLLTSLALGLLIPVLLFYFLKDWPGIIDYGRSLIPPKRTVEFEKVIEKIDEIFSGFLRGQAWVCTAMAAFYSTGLVISGLQYGLLIGILSGFLKYLPYLGTALAVSVAILMAFGHHGFDANIMIGIVLTYSIGEVLESSVLTPKLVGDRVNLSPVVVIFAVLLGGQLYGIIGVFLAVPVFASLRIIAGHYWYEEQNAEHQRYY